MILFNCIIVFYFNCHRMVPNRILFLLFLSFDVVSLDIKRDELRESEDGGRDLLAEPVGREIEAGQ